jgi:hypothetical protein
MTDDPCIDPLDSDIKEVLLKLNAYFGSLIERQNMPLLLANCLNNEMQMKLRDAQESLVAIMEDLLSERGRKSVSHMEPSLRIRYFDSKIDHELATCIRLPGWQAWRPVHSDRVWMAGSFLTGAFGAASILAMLKTAGVTAIKLPIGGTAAAVTFAGLAVFSAMTATHPEKIPNLMVCERDDAREHLGTFLRHAEAALIKSVKEAEQSLDAYIEQLKTEH